MTRTVGEGRRVSMQLLRKATGLSLRMEHRGWVLNRGGTEMNPCSRMTWSYVFIFCDLSAIHTTKTYFIHYGW